jgi:hypothetical protein
VRHRSIVGLVSLAGGWGRLLLLNWRMRLSRVAVEIRSPAIDHASNSGGQQRALQPAITDSQVVRSLQ